MNPILFMLTHRLSDLLFSRTKSMANDDKITGGDCFDSFVLVYAIKKGSKIGNDTSGSVKLSNLSDPI